MKVLVVGSGAKEHAIIWKLIQDNKGLEIIAAPGNAGISEIVECVDIEPTDIKRLEELIIVRQIDLTIVSSIKALCAGLVDKVKAAGYKIFGPSQVASQLESSKFFAKNFMIRHQIPNPNFASFDILEHALTYLKIIKFPIIIKHDPVRETPGKSILNIKLPHGPYSKLVHSLEEAEALLEEIFQTVSRVVIEDFVEGEEISITAFCDKEQALTLLPTQIYKRSKEQDQGEITECLGAFAPTPLIDAETLQRIRERIINPSLNGFISESIDYCAALTFDILIDSEKNPYLLGYHLGFREVEAQVILPLLDESLYNLCLACAEGSLSQYTEGLHKHLGSALSISLHSKENLEFTDGAIDKSDNLYLNQIDFSQLNAKEDEYVVSAGELVEILKAKALIFHASTKKKGDLFLKSTRRNVLNATAVAENLLDAQILAYKLVDKIQFSGKYCRRDIGDKGMV